MFPLSFNRTFLGVVTREKKVRMYNKLLDDAFHCHSTCIMLMLMLMLVVLSRINSMILSLFRLWWDSVSSFTLSLLRFHLKRVDFKFIFICLDLSLELFFISLTISSTLKIVKTDGWVHFSIVVCLSSLRLFLYSGKSNSAHNTHTHVRTLKIAFLRLQLDSMNLNPLERFSTLDFRVWFSVFLSFSTSLSLSFRCINWYFYPFPSLIYSHSLHSLLEEMCGYFLVMVFVMLMKFMFCTQITHQLHHLVLTDLCAHGAINLPWFEFMNFPTIWATLFYGT